VSSYDCDNCGTPTIAPHHGEGGGVEGAFCCRCSHHEPDGCEQVAEALEDAAQAADDKRRLG
jgi:hypothetical protein